MSDVDEAVKRLTAATDYANRGPGGTCVVRIDDLRALLDLTSRQQADRERRGGYIIQLESEIEDLRARLRHHDLL